MHVDLRVSECGSEGALPESEHALEQFLLQDSFSPTGRDHSELGRCDSLPNARQRLAIAFGEQLGNHSFFDVSFRKLSGHPKEPGEVFRYKIGFGALSHQCLVDFVRGQSEAVIGIEADALSCLSELCAMELDVDSEDWPPTAIQGSIVRISSPESMIFYGQSSSDELLLFLVEPFLC
jgi:hypothetical protein